MAFKEESWKEEKKTMVGGVGYRNMRDLSLGPVLTAQMAEMSWPSHVSVDHDLSFGPIAIVQRFQASPDLCHRLVLFAGISRGRSPASVKAYRWAGGLPPADEIQARVGEAVTGVVSLDNLLIIGEFFKIWPPELFIVEVEAVDLGWGPGFSAPVAAVVENVIGIVRQTAIAGEISVHGENVGA